MVLRWIVLGKLQLLGQLRPSPRLEKHVALGDPVEASFAVTLLVQIGDAKTCIEAFVVPGSTPLLISRRWLSQHRCVVNFDPNILCLESPEFLLRSSCVALIWSFALITCESIKHFGPIIVMIELFLETR